MQCVHPNATSAELHTQMTDTDYILPHTTILRTAHRLMPHLCQIALLTIPELFCLFQVLSSLCIQLLPGQDDAEFIVVLHTYTDRLKGNMCCVPLRSSNGQADFDRGWLCMPHKKYAVTMQTAAWLLLCQSCATWASFSLMPVGQRAPQCLPKTYWWRSLSCG
eukprot:GHUV01035060.1.p1 GENE.GHUV01035060.1~~GHUV01035060.1.p1  ORF type:complete len:163 (+),score=5.83 GHUV01035060.1:108-596(+)